MKLEEINKEKILSLAEQTLHKTDLLIAQCDSWLSEEEGMKNVKTLFLKREKIRRKELIMNIINKMTRFINNNKNDK